jgi:hypothetical protein
VQIVRLSFLGFAVCTGILAVGWSPWLAGLGLLLGGACWVLALSLFNVTVQMSTPRWVVGRALSIYQTATFGGMALGSWLWGVVADGWNVEIALLAAGATLLVGAAIGFFLPLPPRVALNLDPANRWKEPHIALDIQSRSGPIVIAINYTIRPEDVPQFLDIMAERKRIRRRDGARNWTLARDLMQPEIWVERYESPTWVDYVRHNQRLTQADAEIGDRLRALNQNPDGVVVRRLIERPTNWLSESQLAPPPPTIEPH